MLMSISNLADMDKTQKNISPKMRSVNLIDRNTKE